MKRVTVAAWEGRWPKDPEDQLAEALRGEVQARGVVQQRMLVDAVQRRLAPLQVFLRESVEDVLDMLEMRGDVSGASGLVAATPLRLLSLREGRFEVIGTLPTTLLRQQIPGTWKAGLLRTGTSENVQGVSVLGPEQLLRSAQIPPGFLSMVALWWENGREPGGSQPVQGWEVYAPSDKVPQQSRRWRSGESGSLWRGKMETGGYYYAWCPEGSPSIAPFLRLDRNTASLAMFALDQAADCPVTIGFHRAPPELLLQLNLMLPHGIFRFLTLIGHKSGTYIHISNDTEVNVQKVLEGCLGCVFKEISQ